MFVKCAYIFDLIQKLDVSNEEKNLIESEINALVNLLMFGDECRPVTGIYNPFTEIHNQGEKNV